MPSSIHASVMLALLWVAAATAADQAPPVSAAPVSFGGRYPHLAVSNEQGECGIGAVVPWAGKLWFITYGPHLPLGSDDGLYEVDQSLALTRRPESVGGTPAARLIHRETDTLAIGPVNGKHGAVRSVLIEQSVLEDCGLALCELDEQSEQVREPSHRFFFVAQVELPTE